MLIVELVTIKEMIFPYSLQGIRLTVINSESIKLFNNPEKIRIDIEESVLKPKPFRCF